LYTGEYPRDVDREEARERLDLPADARVYAFLGLIRTYKNVPGMIRAFRLIPDAVGRLLVAGRAHDDRLAEEVARAAEGDDRVVLRTDFVPPEEVQLYMGSADLVVLPYAEIFNSGAALLALSFQRPILVPEVPTFVELQEDVGPPWVRTYEGPLSPEALRAGMAVSTPDEPAPLDRFDWNVTARETVELYVECRDDGRRRRRRPWVRDVG
jgi:glycosyltransferase involved in cell wall biosynthesis